MKSFNIRYFLLFRIYQKKQKARGASNGPDLVLKDIETETYAQRQMDAVCSNTDVDQEDAYFVLDQNSSNSERKTKDSFILFNRQITNYKFKVKRKKINTFLMRTLSCMTNSTKDVPVLQMTMMEMNMVLFFQINHWMTRTIQCTGANE